MNHDIELTLCTIQDTSCDTMVGFEDGMKSLRGKRNERINDKSQHGLCLGKYLWKNL